MSSNIERLVDCGEYYEFHNNSGSIYTCHKNSVGTSGYMESVLRHYREKVEGLGASIEVIQVSDLCLNESNTQR